LVPRVGDPGICGLSAACDMFCRLQHDYSLVSLAFLLQHFLGRFTVVFGAGGVGLLAALRSPSGLAAEGALRGLGTGFLLASARGRFRLPPPTRRRQCGLASTRGTKVAFGEFGLKATTRGR